MKSLMVCVHSFRSNLAESKQNNPEGGELGTGATHEGTRREGVRVQHTEHLKGDAFIAITSKIVYLVCQ